MRSARQPIDEGIERETSEVLPWKLTPEESLLVAIFDRALRDYLHPCPGLSQSYQRSASWYFENKNGKHEFGTFAHFCYYFDIDMEKTRAIILSEDIKELLKGDSGTQWKGRRL